MTNKEFQDILAQYPDDKRLVFITLCEGWDCSVRIDKPVDPDTEQEYPDSDELWITVD